MQTHEGSFKLQGSVYILPQRKGLFLSDLLESFLTERRLQGFKKKKKRNSIVKTFIISKHIPVSPQLLRLHCKQIQELLLVCCIPDMSAASLPSVINAGVIWALIPAVTNSNQLSPNQPGLNMIHVCYLLGTVHMSQHWHLSSISVNVADELSS